MLKIADDRWPRWKKKRQVNVPLFIRDFFKIYKETEVYNHQGRRERKMRCFIRNQARRKECVAGGKIVEKLERRKEGVTGDKIVEKLQGDLREKENGEAGKPRAMSGKEKSRRKLVKLGIGLNFVGWLFWAGLLSFGECKYCGLAYSHKPLTFTRLSFPIVNLTSPPWLTATVISAACRRHQCRKPPPPPY